MKFNIISKLCLLALAVLPLSSAAQTNTNLSIEDFTISAGQTKTMSIDLNNPDMEVTLVQFDMQLPEGLSIAIEDDEYVTDIARTTYKNHSLNPNKLDDGSIRFLLSSTKNKTLSGNSGAVITVDLTAASTFSSGTITLKNIVIVAPDETAARPAAVELYIGKQQTSVTIVANDQSMAYGDKVPTLTYRVTEGTADGAPEITCEATSSSPVGTYPIKLSNGTLKNDNINLTNGTLTINKAPLTITAKDYTIKEGEELPAFEVEYSGFKNNETKDVLKTQPTVTCSATSGSAAGTYTITVSGADADNYQISYAAGTLTITGKTSVSIVANNLSMTYGGRVPTLTYRVTEGTADGAPEITCEATSTSPVGTYPIKLSNGTLKNDIINLTDGTLTVNKAGLTISARDYTITEGDEIPTFEVDYYGFKNSETEAVLTQKPTITCSATSTSAVGTYDIVVSGASADNYNISYTSGTLTITAKKEVIIVDDKKYESQGDNTVKFTGTDASTASCVIPSQVESGGQTYLVTTIANAAFKNNTSLTEVTLPESITTIESNAFEGCSNLASLTVKSTTPPTLSEVTTATNRAASAFIGVNKDKCILYVPEGCVTAYRSATGWNEFKNILEIGSSAVKGITVDGIQSADVYDLNGRLVRSNVSSLEGLAKGIYMINGKKVVKK